ncbi:acetyl/propionyl/methylcrotonyl-CoA carboxylase subunit alpha [Ferrovibrio sp.]|uniref:acetyl/propionyl/methylcrotonyl-CoA carboxylase subunit alpha n=1 Tax=Ferrovibrio sp. TaxID=1917215 RepID=UPI001B791C01|nr:acetyl/propionyl/methylcrotonyl-CoA carboxylase subunit alpha [Ferrovibrio sp.]MBP7066025.1 acetyl/propionyl/methylcrotonyl-CoA carboxylase subunit alpha [Ferrovibrio sp.]
MFRKILIANRGEIACRVIRTARRLGVATVAVYSDADAGARHVALADEAVRIGPAPVRESYLRAETIIEAARATGAEAVHPGYGFLSENAEFAEALAAAGLSFIGPPASAIRAMGLKGAAKALMQQASVPVVPGYHGDNQDADFLLGEAARIGWPVLIKAVAGGGGKGMRRVDKATDFKAALAGAQREGANAFGNDRVLLEKYLIKPRHIEIQVFADSQGNAVHLFERDCSVQRRHQKVLEEAPAPGMPAEMRRAMGEAAVNAAKAIGYVGAGTVEFIADVSDGLKPDRFYFMEMNTRLQVEHPVTEMITGQDLVEWQLRVAAGAPLPLRQDDLRIDGHAVEARIYAEDPNRNFLPSVGKLHRLRPPVEGPHVRVDTGVREGDSVTPFYDPMIAKLIVWDVDRGAALRRMGQALAEYQIAGVTTNTAFLIALAGHPAFAAGDLDTGFIERFHADLIPPREGADATALALAALAVVLQRRREVQVAASDPWSPWAQVNGWRLNDQGYDELLFRDGERDITLRLDYLADGAIQVHGPQGSSLRAEGALCADGSLEAVLDERRLKLGIARLGADIVLLRPGSVQKLTLVDPRAAGDLDEAGGGALTAPMPGKVVQVLVAEGAMVEKGQALMVLEAMKMEHTIAAPARGKVAKLHFNAGDQVGDGATLIALETEG